MAPWPIRAANWSATRSPASFTHDGIEDSLFAFRANRKRFIAYAVPVGVCGARFCVVSTSTRVRTLSIGGSGSGIRSSSWQKALQPQFLPTPSCRIIVMYYCVAILGCSGSGLSRRSQSVRSRPFPARSAIATIRRASSGPPSPSSAMPNAWMSSVNALARNQS